MCQMWPILLRRYMQAKCLQDIFWLIYKLENPTNPSQLCADPASVSQCCLPATWTLGCSCFRGSVWTYLADAEMNLKNLCGVDVVPALGCLCTVLLSAMGKLSSSEMCPSPAVFWSTMERCLRTSAEVIFVSRSGPVLTTLGLGYFQAGSLWCCQLCATVPASFCFSISQVLQPPITCILGNGE